MQSFKAELPENPRETANLISSSMFCFAMPTFFKGRKKTLEEGDLYRALKEHKSDNLGDKLCKAWEKELEHQKHSHKEASLIRAALRVFGWRIALLGVFLFILEFGLRVTQPLFLGGLITYYSDPGADHHNLTTAYLYALGMILSSAFNVLLMHPYQLDMLHVGMKIRIAMCSMVYRKSLRLSQTALGATSTGQILNLISNDVGRFDVCINNVHYLWIVPLEITIITILMYREIGISSIFGIAFMLLFIPLQGYMGKKTVVLRRRTAILTDERVRIMNEIISGIQVIKMYAWEIPFEKLIQYVRRKELNVICHLNQIRGISESFQLFLTRASIFVSLMGYVLLGQFLTAEKAFAITAYYSILRTTTTVYFPTALSRFAEMMVSIKRIEDFMHHDETKVKEMPLDIDYEHNQNKQTTILEENGKGVKTISAAKETKTVIEIKMLKAKWDPTIAENTLDNINLKIKPRTLVAIIGPVGSGKSSLIQAILGELPADSGSLAVNGTVSYASQEPWLFTGTVRRNILFGLPMEKNRYRTVVKKCALECDFKLLPYGDKTIVGERGASLSGGQKARISLARAIYRKADVYLLDDPLSAVDTHVGRHLFDQCMRGFLREGIVLLVTHQLQFLEQADIIVIMDKGQISAKGSYESMRKSGLDFAKLLTDPEHDDGGGGENKNLLRQSSKQCDRQISISSISSQGDSVADENHVADEDHSPMQVQESREHGRVRFKLYTKYFGASGGYWLFVVTMLFCLSAQILVSCGDYYLSYWVNKNDNAHNENEGGDGTRAHGSNSSSYDNSVMQQREMRLNSNMVDAYIFSGIIVATIIISVLKSLPFFIMVKKSSASLHNAMFRGITRASMYFFNTNPSGRILNRFAKDLGQVDESLPLIMIDFMQIFCSLVGIFIVLSIINPWYLLLTAILGTIFYHLRAFYLSTSRNMKRLEAVTRSPIYSHMGVSLKGLSTIRALGAQQVLMSEFDNYQDLHSSTYFMYLATNRAFAYWLDLSCVLYVTFITLSFFFFSSENGGDVGLAITQAMGMTNLVQWGIRQTADIENSMTSVERVVEYEDLDPEGEFESRPNKKPPKKWPEHGEIIFDNLSLRYFPDPQSERVLKSLNFEIEPCEKVGIVGRTGAGKSSVINALFRLSFNDGSIVIDSRDTNDLGLRDLRSKISIIPQEPVLFSGTMRYNLDPFDEYSDAKLWESLEEVKLKHVIAELPSGLQSKITEAGSNFSVGQRQLVCLARAILRENKILVMDEATANVDPQTDALIQTTIRNKFKNCTVLTIAHRLHTVMDSDKVLVMDAGRAVEYGTPFELLTESKTKIFYGMVKQTGNNTFNNLLKVAQKAHEYNQILKKDSSHFSVLPKGLSI